MKKQLSVLFLLCLSFAGTAQAQQPLHTYARVGVAGDLGANGLGVKPEIGLRWRFIDGSLSYTAVRPWPGDYYFSSNVFMINAAIDFVEVFRRDCPHGFLVGAGFGVSRNFELKSYFADTESQIRLGTAWCLSLKAAYQYEFKNGFTLGAYYEKLLLAMDYNMVGLSVGKTF